MTDSRSASRSDPSAGPTTFGVIDTKTHALVFEPIVVDGPVTSIAFLPAGRLALAIGENARLVVIDAATGVAVSEQAGLDMPDDTIIWTLDPQTRKSGRVLRRPSSVAVAGNELLLGAGDGTLRVLDGETFEVRRTVTLDKQTLSRLWPLEDGTVVTAGRFGVTRLDLTAGTTRWKDTEFERCINLTVVEARGVLFCGDQYGRLEERDLATGAILRRLDSQNGNSGSLWSAAGGTELVSFGNNEPVVSRWRLDESGPITRLVAPGWITIDFDHSGDRLLMERGNPFDDSYEAASLDVEDGSIAATIEDLVSPYWAGPDSLFGIGRSPDGSIEFATLDLDDGAPAAAAVTHGTAVERSGEISDLRLDSGKEKMLLRYRVGNDSNSLASFDPTSQQYGPTIPVDGLVSWAISRTGDRIAAGTANGVVIFDANTGEQVDALTDEDLRGVFITATDQLFVSSLGGELTQYDLQTLEPIRTFGGSRGHVFGGSGTADGSLIAIHGGDRRAALFDVASGDRIGGPITIAADANNFARLSLDGRWLAVGGQRTDSKGENATQIWTLDPEQWAARRVPRCGPQPHPRGMGCPHR